MNRLRPGRVLDADDFRGMDAMHSVLAHDERNRPVSRLRALIQSCPQAANPEPGPVGASRFNYETRAALK